MFDWRNWTKYGETTWQQGKVNMIDTSFVQSVWITPSIYARSWIIHYQTSPICWKTFVYDKCQQWGRGFTVHESTSLHILSIAFYSVCKYKIVFYRNGNSFAINFPNQRNSTSRMKTRRRSGVNGWVGMGCGVGWGGVVANVTCSPKE